MSLRLPLLPEPIRWVPAGAVAVAIWYWSLVTTPPTLFLLEARIIPTLLLEITTSPTLLSLETATQPPLRPLETAPTHNAAITSGADGGSASIPASTVRHVVAYATLAVCLVYALAGRGGSLSRAVILAFVLATGYGAAMEVGQLFQPERTASLADIGINALGATAAVSWYGLERRVTFIPLSEFRREIRQPA